MPQYIQKFLDQDRGAISVDWVVLTAAVVGLMFAALAAFLDGITTHADLTAETIAALPVAKE